MPETDLLDLTCAEVFKSVVKHYLGQNSMVYQEGTAKPPDELERCLDYYSAVHARHHSNFAMLKERVRVWLFRAINDREMSEAAVGIVEARAWMVNSSWANDPRTTIEPVFSKAARMAQAGENEWKTLV